MGENLRLAFSTLPCVGWDVDKVIKYCRECGYGGIELRLGGQGLLADSVSGEDFRVMAGKLQEARIVVTDLASSVCVRGTSQREMEKAGRELEGVFGLAGIFRAKGIRIFLGNFNSLYTDRAEVPDSCLLTAFLREYCHRARKLGLEIWIETHNEFATGRSLRDLLEQVGCDNCKIIWDVMHPLEDGEGPEETYGWLGEDCVHVHIKDGIPYKDGVHHDWKYTFVGEGIVPIGHIVDILEKAGYEGYYSLEWETAWREELKVPGAEAEKVLPAFAGYMRGLQNGQARK